MGCNGMKLGDKVQVAGLYGVYRVISYTKNERNVECVLDNGEYRLCIKRLLPNFKVIKPIKHTKPAVNPSDPAYYLDEMVGYS